MNEEQRRRRDELVARLDATISQHKLVIDASRHDPNALYNGMERLARELDAHMKNIDGFVTLDPKTGKIVPLPDSSKDSHDAYGEVDSSVDKHSAFDEEVPVPTFEQWWLCIRRSSGILDVFPNDDAGVTFNSSGILIVHSKKFSRDFKTYGPTGWADYFFWKAANPEDISATDIVVDGRVYTEQYSPKEKS